MFSWRQFACFLLILDLLTDFGTNEFASFFIGLRIDRQIAKSPEHKSESITLIPSFLKFGLSFLGRYGHTRDSGFLKAKCDS